MLVVAKSSMQLRCSSVGKKDKQSMESPLFKKKMSSNNGKEGAVDLPNSLEGPQNMLNETKASERFRGYEYINRMIF